MNEQRVVFIGQGPADVTGGGGAHRTYQLLYELSNRFGADKVSFLTAADLGDTPASAADRISDSAAQIVARFLKVAENPLHVAFKSGFFSLLRNVARSYREILRSRPKLEFCVVEDPNLVLLREINDAAGIKTILAPWSLNSVTEYLPRLVDGVRAAGQNADSLRERTVVRAAFSFLGDEVLLHARAGRSWLLSRVEQGLLRSLGAAAEYLPFYPVGEAMAQSRRLRGKRSAATVDPGLFVISGSPIHQNNLALADFLATLDQDKLAASVRIAVVGFDDPPARLAPYIGGKVQFLGRLDGAGFEDLLVRARAVLVPQIAGFGCLTRVPEMLAAGIPVLVDEMTAHATGAVPGACYVAPGKNRWTDAIRSAAGEPKVIAPEVIKPWIEASRQQAAGVLRRL